MRLALAALLALGATAVNAASPFVVKGTAHVIDGDSIIVTDGATKTSIRLFGIDAPESAQVCEGKITVQCGAASRRTLEQIIGSQIVTCEARTVDRYKRVVAICTLPDGRDISAELVHSGQAIAYRRYSTRYEAQEIDAKKRGLGLWGYGFKTPEDFRKDSRKP